MIFAKDIYKGYKQNILNGVSFKAYPGTLTGIAGKNGAGKSTLLKILSGILKSDKGDIYIDENNISNESKICYIPQENALFSDLTVKDNLKFFCSISNVPFNDFNLEKDLLNKKIHELSGGMKKRINILASLINNPDYVLLDEPTANLDLYNKELILNLMTDLVKSGKCLILSSHDLDELYSSDVLYVLKDGKFVFNEHASKFGDFETFKKNIYDIIRS